MVGLWIGQYRNNDRELAATIEDFEIGTFLSGVVEKRDISEKYSRRRGQTGLLRCGIFRVVEEEHKTHVDVVSYGAESTSACL